MWSANLSLLVPGVAIVPGGMAQADPPTVAGCVILARSSPDGGDLNLQVG